MTEARFSASITTMFREFDLADRFAAAMAAGFDGVEIQDLGEGDVEVMAKAAKAAGAPVLLINADMGDFRQGGPGLSGVPGREAAFAAAFEQTALAAERLGARFIHLGPSRIPKGASRAACLATWRRNLAVAVDRLDARKLDAVLLVEAINPIDYPEVLIGNLDEAAEALAEAPEDRTGLLFDIYHLAMGGRDLSGQFRAHRRGVRHVQFSNIPGRDEPDVGDLDIAGIFDAFAALGYGGWFGAEYTPRRPTLETLEWLRGRRNTQR